jgi:hypothetical protein
MNTMATVEIEQLIKNNMIHRFTNELTDCTDEKRRSDLDSVLKSLKPETKAPVPIMSAHDKLTQVFGNVDRELYKQPWPRLRPAYKKTKVSEFININHNDLPNKQQLLDQLNKMVDDNQLSTKRTVEYDPKSAKIVKIPILEVNGDKWTIKVKK